MNQPPRSPELSGDTTAIKEVSPTQADSRPALSIDELFPEPRQSTNDGAVPGDPQTPAKGSLFVPSSLGQDAKVMGTYAQWGWRGKWNRYIGQFLLNLNPSTEEQKYRDAVSIIRTATWPRPMNVVVANTKGGSGKTLATVLLSDVLSMLRGGQIATWEACEIAGTLADRVRLPTPNNALPRFLKSATSINSLHEVSQYLTSQPSHAQTLASSNPRAELDANDVMTIRDVLDKYFTLTITDTGNNPLHPAWKAAVTTADALVIPCMTSADSVKGALDTLAALEEFDDPAVKDPNSGLRSRVVVVATTPPGIEQTGTALAPLREAGVRVIQRTPFTTALAEGTPVSLHDLNQDSQHAWLQIGAATITALTGATMIQSPI